MAGISSRLELYRFISDTIPEDDTEEERNYTVGSKSILQLRLKRPIITSKQIHFSRLPS